MSRVGRKPVAIPSAVTITHKDGAVEVKGPKGTLRVTLSARVKVDVAAGEVRFGRPDDLPPTRALHGLVRATVQNMVVGVTQGFSRELEIQGTGNRAEVKGKSLNLTVGYSHPVEMTIPEGLKVSVSGLDTDSGRICGRGLRADHTLTFLGLKPGLFTADGPDYSGELHLDTLGVDPATLPATPGIALTQLETRHRLPPRARNSHKGQFGHIGIIGGSSGMVGACLIAGRAALQQGAGSVTVGTLDERVVVDFVEPRLTFATPEMLTATRLDALAIGPGLGQRPRAHALLEAALSTPCPLVLDADALNLLAGDRDLASMASRRAAPTLLTPHPGEAARLLGLRIADIQANRIGAARRLRRGQ